MLHFWYDVLQMYKQAIEEAKEVCDRRAGRFPLTNYRYVHVIL